MGLQAPPDAGGFAKAADWDTLSSPETYVGYARGERRSDNADELALNRWALAGRQRGAIAERIFEFTFLDPGVRVRE